MSSRAPSSTALAALYHIPCLCARPVITGSSRSLSPSPCSTAWPRVTPSQSSAPRVGCIHSGALYTSPVQSLSTQVQPYESRRTPQACLPAPLLPSYTDLPRLGDMLIALSVLLEEVQAAMKRALADLLKVSETPYPPQTIPYPISHGDRDLHLS